MSEPPLAAPRIQSVEEADAKTRGCKSCHLTTDRDTMHASPAVVLGCTDCHGGDATVHVAPDDAPSSAEYEQAKLRAHVRPDLPDEWPGPANPPRSYTLLNRERPEYVRFVNPGDLRVAREACGACHLETVVAVERSLMANAAMFWGGASYNNGILPFKRSILGETYTRDGEAAKQLAIEEPTAAMREAGILPWIVPLPAWETVPPGDIFRVFESGGTDNPSTFASPGLPNPRQLPGRPDIHASRRGPGTGLRVAIPVLNIHKTRLNDPLLWFMGTSDQPGDYRSSGCSACHVVYANDRDVYSSGVYARHGHRGQSATSDPTIASRRDPDGEPERGHPIRHELTRAIPTSQCMTCHHHQPNMFVNSYLGFTMWDYESDAELMWPEEQVDPSIAETHQRLERNPEGAGVRGRWADIDFVSNVWTDVNPSARHTQFADYHGHGWNFRAIFKRARDGTLLDADGAAIDDTLAPQEKWKRAVHMRDIHAEVGMQCADCHFAQDSHGDGHMYQEVAAAVEIACQDCHGSVERVATLETSGPAAPPRGNALAALRNSDGRRRFVWRDGELYQRLILPPHKELRVSQVRHSIDPEHAGYNPLAARAKTMVAGHDQSWGRAAVDDAKPLAHADSKMSCATCHSSWVTSCAGCHLPSEANRKTPLHHFEGGETRNYATYNPQVARDDMFQLGRHSQVKDNIIAPVRSSSALVLSSRDANQGLIYMQQPPVSSAGYSSQAFAPHFPHTVRKTETKTCTDCHLSAADDNNAIMAQLLLLGTQFVSFVGHHAWVGAESGLEAIRVTEWSEPQAVIGSFLHRVAYPDWYRQHVTSDRRLERVARERADSILAIQHRGEYLYTAGPGGARVYDIARIGHEDFSQRIVSSPYSSLGQSTHIDSRDATFIALPTNQMIRPELNRAQRADHDNLEQEMHPIYSYAAITDREEGLILVDVETLGDGEPRNNFLRRAVTWNPEGVLDGAVHARFAGHLLYVSTPRGVVVVDLDQPLQPRLLSEVAAPGARAVEVQFRYLFVVADAGLQVVDVTHPESPRVIDDAVVALADGHRLHVARTYAYIAAGREGLAIIDIERPEHPRLVTKWTADGALDDARDVVVASTNASLFAYVADGSNGLKVVQLTSPESQPKFYGFSPEPRPELIAWAKTSSPAVALSRGLERDRAVDETGHQIAVFGRLGSRPFTLEEMRRLYLDPDGKPWRVADRVEGEGPPDEPNEMSPGDTR